MAFFFRPKLVDTLKGYTREQLGVDVAAGLTVGVVALPLAMACMSRRFFHGTAVGRYRCCLWRPST